MRVNRVSHLFSLLSHSPVEAFDFESLPDKRLIQSASQNQLKLDIKRDDCLHPILSGNKWRKLKYVLLDIESKGYSAVASMGGRYSNFLHSLAFVCRLLGWQFTAFVRGYKEQVLTPMLRDIIQWGANIIYLDKKPFKEIRLNKPELNDGTYWLHEGGYNQLALKGVAETFMELQQAYDYLTVATATGTSLAGYADAISKLGLSTQLIGIPVLYNTQQIKENIASFKLAADMPKLVEGYEFGGYAKTTPQLNSFINSLRQNSSMPVEPIYIGKSLFAVTDLIKRGYFKKNSRILLVHCGGLQGLRSESL
jgi:1-aminocyclopropane-1-carboxylate deaminase